MPSSISPEVMAVLKQSTVLADRIQLPPTQLDRKLYVAVNQVIEGLGGKWNRKAGAHLFKCDPRAKLAQAMGDGAFINEQQEYQLFETPVPLAKRMVEMAGISSEHFALEPSAGYGRILREIVSRTANCFYCEINPDCLKSLSEFPAKKLCDDFLLAPWTRYDRIVMNPPFTNGQDIQHIERAYSMLTQDGVLVALSAPSWQFRNTKKFAEFREWFDGLKKRGMASCEEIPAGTFKESGTNVRTLLLKLERK